MISTSDRRYTRRDTVLFLLCLGLSLFGLFSPAPWGHKVADTLRETVLSPWSGSRPGPKRDGPAGCASAR